MPSLDNRVVIAAAGSAKTQSVIDQALSAPDERILVVTYTNENLRQLRTRLAAAGDGTVPMNVELMTWFSFLLGQVCKPYQRSVTGLPGFIDSVNFISDFPKIIPKTKPLSRYLDRAGNLYSDGAAEFGCLADDSTDGAVIRRLEQMYDQILIDEVQDLVAYDLVLLEKLLRSSIRVTAVGDPRQFLYSTNRGSKYSQYRGPKIVDWFRERSDMLAIEERSDSHRCSASLCVFASELFPTFEPMTSCASTTDDYEGIDVIPSSEVAAYIDKWNPTCLKVSAKVPTYGFAAINIGVAKGSTYDRVLIFPTKTMLEYVNTRKLAAFKDPSRLYVAVTRARFTAVFVEP